ncbi:uncharacterized protein LOC127855092 [Dreissena polymorpha]|uniref:Uncharacterized protein n=1 Tax=Dreissena polymorpha TaxID=45954 RepID=A0A9D4HF71_DREPO|nr:uncharacterized protein LOC127855092 [Dreissena polymorpha]KAH3715518.1 hypothetical protein DPMN_058229 [Dreissena polymorpha]
MSMFGEARRAKKDVLADLVSLKYDIQDCIAASSMRKAVLTSSEEDIRADMALVVEKLTTLLEVSHDNARLQLNQETKGTREKVNDEIIYLEELHKSLDDMEEYVKTNTSNTNLKPLKIGKEKCDATRSTLENFKANVKTSCAKFVLHPLLGQILEHMETFALGKTVIMDAKEQIGVESIDRQTLPEEQDFDDDIVIGIGELKRDSSQDPLRTSFIRSNSSKLIQLQPTKRSATSRQETGISNKSGLFRQESIKSIDTEKGYTGLPSRLNSRTDASIKTVTRQNSSTEGVTSRKETKLSKLITKRPRKESTTMAKNQETMNNAEQYRDIQGLKATIAYRTNSAPLINLPTKTKNEPLASIIEESSPITMLNRETLNTKVHENGCHITSIAVLANGSVVLCDNVHDSIQLYNPLTKSVSEMECSKPWGVATVGENAVAVTLHYNHKIILLKVQQGLEKINEKDIELKCKAALTYDVKFYAYRLYVLCINSDIHVLDLKGREFKVIKTGIAPNTLRYFDIDVERDTVVVSGEKGVACISKGMPLWHFKPQIGKAKITCTGVKLVNQCVIVCDWENFRLAEIYEDGLKIRTVHGEGLERPVAMAISPAGDTFFVSQGDYDMEPEKTRMIKVMNAIMKEE